MPAAQSTILVVEDELALLRLLTARLVTAGYTVVEAESGTEAIDALDQHYPPLGALRLVLLDMLLPDGDGLAVLRYVAARGALVPVVAMSTSRELLAAAVAAGAQDILSKPFDSDTLLAVVAHYCPG
jgi:CheY-like chemotaxis protein